MIKQIRSLVLAAGLGMAASAALAVPPGDSITYQGSLSQNGSVVDTPRDFRFRLYDAASGGTLIVTVQKFNVDVVSGVFSTDIDFGSAPWTANEQLWIEIEAGPADGSQSYEIIGRQKLAATPYSLSTRGIAVDSNLKVGIGTDVPARLLHVDDGFQLAPGSISSNTDILVTSTDAALSLVSDSSGGVGSFIDFMEQDGAGTLIDNWGILRTTSGSGSNLEFTYGPNTPASGNPAMMTMGPNGNIGIGTAPAIGALEIRGATSSPLRVTSPIGAGIRLKTDGTSSSWSIYHEQSSDNLNFRDSTTGATRMAIRGDNGYVGIGTSTPNRPLTVARSSGSSYIGITAPIQTGILFGTSAGATNGGVLYNADIANGLSFRTNANTTQMVIGSNGFVGIGTSTPSTTLDINGAVTIRGGADIVEGFESICDTAFEPGTVLVIDPDNAGMLMCADSAYDKRVAGVVSGAGGVLPGIKLGQDGVMDGDIPVAMTGRVYVKCSSENGAITPGDLLTTASLSGHAMKATDNGRSNGSVIGKAMGSLDSETGLVLVLVNLQ